MHILQKLIQNDGRFECRNYSGRGMYGKSCLGVIINRGESFGDLFAHIIEGMEYFDVEDLTKEDLVMGIQTMEYDSLGMDTIVYFRKVPFCEHDDEDEFDDDDTDGEEE